MNKRQIPERTKQKIAKIEAVSTDLFYFISEAIDLLYNFPNYEVETPSKFDDKTGEPVEFKWVQENFKDKIIYINPKNSSSKKFGSLSVLYFDCKCQVRLEKLFEESPISIELPDKKSYILTKEYHEIYKGSGQWPVGIRVSILNKKLDIEGIVQI